MIMRIDDLLQNRVKKVYEKGAWIIFEKTDGTFEVSSARLGNHTFKSESDMNKFIEENFRGYPASYGNVDFIRVSYANTKGEPPKEL